MHTTHAKCLLCGVGLLTGMMAITTAEAADGAVLVGTLSYRVVDNQPAQVQTVGYRIGGYSHYGYGYRPRVGFSFSYGYRPRYDGYGSYSSYGSYYRAPYYGYSYYRPRYFGYTYYRPRYYGYSHYQPAVVSYSYYRPLYYSGYYYGYSIPYVSPSFGGIRYHGSYGYGSACCN